MLNYEGECQIMKGKGFETAAKLKKPLDSRISKSVGADKGQTSQVPSYNRKDGEGDGLSRVQPGCGSSPLRVAGVSGANSRVHARSYCTAADTPV